MKIKGLIENSFLDWDGKIATLVFTGGCNFRCPFCYNKELVLNSVKMKNISEDDILKYVFDNKKWIDGIVVTGGEPLLQKNLLRFLRKIKDTGFLVKLDTNGYLSGLLKEVVSEGVVDYVAMDIKSGIAKNRYLQATGIDVDIKRIEQSINFLLEGDVDHEFRTTIVPSIVELDDLLNIASFLNGNSNSKWAWQNFKKIGELLDSSLEMIMPYMNKNLDEFELKVKTKFKNINIIRR